MSFEQKVRFILETVFNPTDAYFIIKSLLDNNTKFICLNPTFLDSKQSRITFNAVHGIIGE